MYNNELYHFGVKGMKWGVRKVREDKKREGKPIGTMDGPNYSRKKPIGTKYANNDTDRKGKKPPTKEHKKEMRKKGVQTATAVLGGQISGLALKHLVSKTDLGLYRGTQTASYILGSWLGGAYVYSLYEDD